jgi:hypothetical protein
VDNSVDSHFHLSSVDDCSRMVQTYTAEGLIREVDSVVSHAFSSSGWDSFPWLVFRHAKKFSDDIFNRRESMNSNAVKT